MAKLPMPALNNNIVTSLDNLAKVNRELLAWLRSHMSSATKQDLVEMEKRIMIKISEIKAAVATAAKQSKEAFAELATRITDLQKKIDDLIAGVGDPDVDDAAFEADLKSLGEDVKALAEIVTTTPTEPPPALTAERGGHRR